MNKIGPKQRSNLLHKKFKNLGQDGNNSRQIKRLLLYIDKCWFKIRMQWSWIYCCWILESFQAVQSKLHIDFEDWIDSPTSAEYRPKVCVCSFLSWQEISSNGLRTCQFSIHPLQALCSLRVRTERFSDTKELPEQQLFNHCYVNEPWYRAWLMTRLQIRVNWSLFTYAYT